MSDSEWQPWFAWYPVQLLTLEWAWLRTVLRRETTGDFPMRPTGKYDYANNFRGLA